MYRTDCIGIFSMVLGTQTNLSDMKEIKTCASSCFEVCVFVFGTVVHFIVPHWHFGGKAAPLVLWWHQKCRRGYEPKGLWTQVRPNRWVAALHVVPSRRSAQSFLVATAKSARCRVLHTYPS